MTLTEHLKELRYRVIAAVIAVIIGMLFCGLFFDSLYNWLQQPYNVAAADLAQTRPGTHTQIVNIGVTAPFMLAMKVVGIAGLVVSSPPLWLYQLWAFIAPGLLRQEKKWALLFVGSSVPLFAAGVWVGYLVMPKGIEMMLSFTPGIGTGHQHARPALLPGLPGPGDAGLRRLLPVAGRDCRAEHGRGGTRGATVQGALLRDLRLLRLRCDRDPPSTDPFSMIALSLPMSVLYVIAEFICRAREKGLRKKEVATQ